MLEVLAEQVTEITVVHVESEFTPATTTVQHVVLNLVFLLQQMPTAFMAPTSCEGTANSRQKPLEAWRRLQKRCDPRQQEENETCCARLFLLDDALCWNFKLISNDGNPTSRATRKRLKDSLDDEIKHAGVEALEPEEVEKHLTLNSNHL